ncbi:MAG: YdcH family protein [Parvularcula sp.]
MTNVPHQLSEEFPEFIDLMHQLKGKDAHFEKLAEEYHDLNRDIHRAESDIEPTSDEHMEEMKSKRVQLKDKIFTLLKQAE